MQVKVLGSRSSATLLFWLLLMDFHFFNMFIVLKYPTLFEIWSHKCWIEENNHFLQPAVCCFLIQPNVWLMVHDTAAHHWFAFNLLSSNTPWSFSVKLASSHLSLKLYCCQGSSVPEMKNFYFSLMNFVRFQSAHSSSLLRFHQMATLPSSISAAPLSVHCSVLSSL